MMLLRHLKINTNTNKKCEIHLILTGFKILAILKVEKDSFMIMPFNPTRLKHRDFTTSISAPWKSDLRNWASLDTYWLTG